jgi:hypothetical protein
MNREELVGGGYLVHVVGGSGLAVEEVPSAKRGLVVQSAYSHLDGTERRAGRYVLTQRAVRGSDLWRVRRVAPSPRVVCMQTGIGV